MTDQRVPFGWSPDWAEAADGKPAARVVSEHRGFVDLVGADGPLLATVSGRILHEAEDARDLPAVGDWVTHAEPDDEGRVRVDRVLPRRTAVVRRAAGTDPEPQVVAANVDTVLVMSSLDGDLNPRRLERYLAVVAASGADPVIVLSKLDAADDAMSMITAVRSVADEVPILPLSNVTGDGLDAVRSLVGDGETVAIVGSSGVGKSTLANALLGEERLATGDVRDDGRGRHTTVRRELVPVPGGGVLLDTPGMRELQLWDEESLADAFPEIAEAAERCRFADCRHGSEPGCAVRAAVEAGDIRADRFESYVRLRDELDALAEEQEQRRRRRRR
ncbi:MAG: ribosome small subunit-dependent GTPase A [Actinomycetota bacterium]